MTMTETKPNGSRRQRGKAVEADMDDVLKEMETLYPRTATSAKPVRRGRSTG